MLKFDWYPFQRQGNRRGRISHWDLPWRWFQKMPDVGRSECLMWTVKILRTSTRLMTSDEHLPSEHRPWHFWGKMAALVQLRSWQLLRWGWQASERCLGSWMMVKGELRLNTYWNLAGWPNWRLKYGTRIIRIFQLIFDDWRLPLAYNPIGPVPTGFRKPFPGKQLSDEHCAVIGRLGVSNKGENQTGWFPALNKIQYL